MREIKRAATTFATPPVQPSKTALKSLAGAGMDKYTTLPPERPREGKKPFISSNPQRDYSAMYRLAFAYHQRHSPPTIDRAYWASHTPGVDDTPEADLEYWRQAAADIGQVSEGQNNDPFMIDLLSAAYSELEREYKRLREQAAGGQ